MVACRRDGKTKGLIFTRVTGAETGPPFKRTYIVSRHSFHTNVGDLPVTVVMGWQSHLNGYYMFIENDSKQPGDEMFMFYTCETDGTLMALLGTTEPKTIDYFIDHLSALHIILPSIMIDHLLASNQMHSERLIVNYWYDESNQLIHA